MIDRLRTPFFILALILMFLVALVETGTALPGVLGGSHIPLTSFQLPPQVSSATLNSDQQNELTQASQGSRPSGFGISSLALLDSIVLLTVLLMGAALIIPARLQGRVQGIVTLLFSLLLIGLALRQILLALASLILMIALLLSVPFGTIIYLIIYGSFNRAGADVALSLIMLLKFGFSGSLVLAQQRVLQSKGLILLVATSFLSTLIVSFLLGLVPGFLVSITDAIAAIVVGIIAIIWAIILLVGAIIAILKAIRLDRSVS